MRSRKAALIITCLLWAASVQAAPRPLTTHHSPLTIIIIDRIDFRDLLAADAPMLKRLMNEGAVGLISPRVVGALTSESACVTIGAGTPAVADEQARRSCNILMPREGDRSETGPHFDLAGVLHEGIAALQRLNRQELTLAQPGLLGTLLHRHRLKTGVVDGYPSSRGGNCGPVTTIAVDEDGRVDKGYVGGHGGFTIYGGGQVYPESIEADLGDAHLRVIHPNRTTDLHKTDVFLREWLKLIDLHRTRVMIVTPCPRTNKKYFPRLAPVIMVGKGVKRGVLTSPSTRQRGLVTLADIAPTALEYFNVPKDERMVGQAMTVLPSQDAVAELKRLDGWLAARHPIVAPIAALMAAWQAIATALALMMMRVLGSGFWVLGGKGEKHPSSLISHLSSFCRFLLLGAVSVPLAALFVSPLATWGTAAVLALTVVLTCALSGIALLRKNALASLQLVAAFAVLTLIADALWGGRWSSTSILGNSFATGTRFYGIGNEYAGYLIATALVAAGLTRIFEERKSWLPWIGLLSLALVLGYNRWGANFGGATTAAAACAVAMVKARSQRFGWRQVLLAALVVATSVALILGLEFLSSSESQSHIGRAFSQVGDGNAGLLAQIAKRKLQMNWNSIRFTPFNYPMLMVIPALAVALHWRRGKLKAALSQHCAFDAGMVGGVVGAVVALVMNDSGIVMVGILLGALVPALVLVVQSEGMRDER